MTAERPQALRDEGMAAVEAEEQARAEAHAKRALVQPLNRAAQARDLAGDEPEAKRVRKNYAKRTGKAAK